MTEYDNELLVFRERMGRTERMGISRSEMSTDGIDNDVPAIVCALRV